MSRSIHCPHCRKSIRAAEDVLGRKVRCPGCQGVFVAATEERAPVAQEKVVAASAPNKPSAVRSVMPPAIALLITGILGLLINGYQVGVALFDPHMFKEIPKNISYARGVTVPPTYAAAVGFIFAVVAIVTVVGAICMMRRKAYGLAMTGTILAMVNIGNGCCLLGVPIGIWTLIMLSRADAKDAFSS